MNLLSSAILEKKGIRYRLIELEDRAITVADVVKHSSGNVNSDEICKTIIVKDEKGNKYAIFLLGGSRIDFSKAKKEIGAKVSIATADEVKETAGVEPGAVCPLLLKIPLFVDKHVLEEEKINFGSGDHLFGIEIEARDLEKAVEFRVVEICK